MAHVGGLPVEEILTVLMSGVGGWLILVLTWIVARVQRPGSVSLRRPGSRAA